MRKISKYSNVYDKNGNLLRHVNDDGVLKEYSMEELETLIDELANDKDENGNVKNPQALNNANQIYFMICQRPENAAILRDRFTKIQEEYKKQKESQVPENEQITQKLNEVAQQLKDEAIKEGLIDEEPQKRPSDDPEYSMDKYVDFEEIPAAA
jgi:hypothetical protein